MKKISLIIPLFVIFFSLLFVKSVDAACVTMNVSLANTGNWPAGESVRISCKGDNPPGPSNCTGDSTTIKPGEKKTLTQCTCPDGGHPDSGCLVVESKPAACSEPVAQKTNYCATNGSSVNANLTAKCEAPPSQGVCKPGETRTTPNCRKCSSNGQWNKDYSVGDWQTCFCQDNPNDASCKPATECKPGDVQKLPKACRVCDVNGKWKKDYTGQDWQACKCIDSPEDPACKKADPGPNDPGPQDPGPNNPGPQDPGPNNPGPQDPRPNDPQPATFTPVPPTPTPDPFNEAMCKCGGMTASQIIAGQSAIFTATGKVEGTDTQYAQIKEIEFLLSVPSTKQRVAGPQRVPATVLSQSTTSVQYQSQWNVQIPSNVQRGVEYVAQATVKCSRKTNAGLPFTAVVMGASDENKGLFGIIMDFFAKLFRQNSSEDETPASTTTQQDETVTVFGEDKLQLGSFTPATVTESSCRSVKFKF